MYSNGEKDQEETPLNCNSSFIYHLSIRGNQILKKLSCLVSVFKKKKKKKKKRQMQLEGINK